MGKVNHPSVALSIGKCLDCKKVRVIFKDDYCWNCYVKERKNKLNGNWGRGNMGLRDLIRDLEWRVYHWQSSAILSFLVVGILNLLLLSMMILIGIYMVKWLW